MKLAVLIAPYATATEDELATLSLVQTELLGEGIVPIFAPDVLRSVLDDDVPEERAVGLRASQTIVRWVAASGGEAHVIGDRVTEGMRLDLAAWREATSRAPLRHRVQAP